MTSGMPQQLFHLGHEDWRIATTMPGRCGRNPAPLIAKMGRSQQIGVLKYHGFRRRRSGLGWRNMGFPNHRICVP